MTNTSIKVRDVNLSKEGAKRDKRDPRTIASVLDMLSTLSQRIELFERFVRKRATVKLVILRDTYQLLTLSLKVIQEQLQKKSTTQAPTPSTIPSNATKPKGTLVVIAQSLDSS